MREFLNLLQFTYTVPHQKAIGDRLLIECYNEIYTEVLENIRKNDFINVFTDKSFTFTRQRVINYCIFVKVRSFYMEQALVKIGLISTEWQVDFLKKRFETFEARLFYGERLSMINSVATDTCAIMRSL
jgi:hypothetical protein